MINQAEPLMSQFVDDIQSNNITTDQICIEMKVMDKIGNQHQQLMPGLSYHRSFLNGEFSFVYLISSRRIDPYTRSCAILGSLFAIGFVLIVIVVLSLIPIYLSHQSSTKKTNIQVASK